MSVIVFDSAPAPAASTIEQEPTFLLLDAPAAPSAESVEGSPDFILIDPLPTAAVMVAEPGDFILLDAPSEPTTAVAEGGGDIVVISSGGLRGLKGEPGTQWWASAGVPAPGLGVPKDWAVDTATGDYYEHTGAGWVLRGAMLQGIQGDKGNTGDTGLSAYEQAVLLGFAGSEAAWIASLKGAKGDTGSTGPSAYQHALNNGFSGTEAQWLTSLRGIDGSNGTNGANGLNAYEVAVAGGFVGTQTEWQNSLKTAASGAMLTRLNPTAMAAATGERDVIFDAVSKVDGDFSADLATGRITLPSDGWYAFEGHVRFLSGATQGVVASIRNHSGSTSIIRGTQIDADTYTEATVSGIAWLPGGTKVYLSIWTASSPQVQGNAEGNYTYFRAVLLSTGPRGMSAYQVAQGAGFTGTVNEWLESLVGPTGPAGKDATLSTLAERGSAQPARGTLDFDDPGFDLVDDAGTDKTKVKTSFTVGVGTKTITVGNAAPGAPSVGDLWVDTN